MKELKYIETFGAIDADNDSVLLKAFEDHESYIDIKSFNKSVVIGRKGTGKTAIFKKILTLPISSNLTYGHTFSDYPWAYHDKVKNENMMECERYLHSWKYLILLTLSKIIINQDASLPIDDESLELMTKLESFVIDSYGTKDPDLTQIFTPSKKLKLKPYLGISWQFVSAGITPESVSISELPLIFPEVNSNLIDYVFTILNPENNYYILFDQLDMGFDPKSEDYNNRIISLLLAARDLNVAAKEYGKNVNIVIFLRDDIYNNLHFEDKNKITRNYVTTIEWDTANTQKTLKRLMERRFSILLSEDSEKVDWEDVFDESQKMPGRQNKYQHILDRTYLRPRDIIYFCNEILKTYKREESQEEKKFTNKNIHDSRLEYSTYFSDELDDEIHKHIPEYNDFFEIFRSIGCLQFTKEEFTEQYSQVKKRKPQLPDPEYMLTQLYNFSIIGFYRAGGQGYGGSEYIYKYKYRRLEMDLTAESFRIHPGLMEFLGLKKYSKT